MDIFGVLELIGGLALFLFGMSIMGTGLEKSAGNKLKNIIERLTSKRLNGLFMGAGVTTVIQSSSATTVMVVGFVNSGVMTLKQAIHVIMGANIGTTITSWILSLTGIQSSNFFIKLLKPSSFTPILAAIGIVYYMFLKSDKKKDIGLILLGFATLIFGMEVMSSSVKPLGELEGFRNAFLLFTNPILGVLVGALFTALIQSSSASVGILQALSATGQVTVGATIPIIMGQNIGTTVTALLSSIGTNKNARRAALVHLYFNIIGTVTFLVIYMVARSIFALQFVNGAANHVTIAAAHTAFNIACTALLLPFSGLLERLAYKTIKDDQEQDKISLLDKRLFSTPAIAINRSRTVATEMGRIAREALHKAIDLLDNYDEKLALEVKEAEQQTDNYEDALGTYLVRLSGQQLSARDNREAAKLLYVIGEFERIGDYALNIERSAEEMYSKKIKFSDIARKQIGVMIDAVLEVADLAFTSFDNNDLDQAKRVEPLEEVIDDLKYELKKHHINRLQANQCTIELGFIYSDLIMVLERISDHCSNIAGVVIELSRDRLDLHEYLHSVKHDPNNRFAKYHREYAEKYSLKDLLQQS